MDDLTGPQRRVLKLIAEGADRGMAPTHRELCKALGLVSTNGPAEFIKSLLRKGCLEKLPNRARGLLLTAHGRRELGRST